MTDQSWLHAPCGGTGLLPVETDEFGNQVGAQEEWCPGPHVQIGNKFADPDKVQWICEYPEFGDSGCLYDHDPELSRQPRKHQECGWYSVERIEETQ